MATLLMLIKANWESYSAQYAATEALHIAELCRQIDRSKVCSRVSTLREGILYTVDISRKSLSAMMGAKTATPQSLLLTKSNGSRVSV